VAEEVQMVVGLVTRAETVVDREWDHSDWDLEL